ncbi:MAG: hypothetical protein A2Y34_14630 [Spirochaetes bacterium GWC1_27_15]|nr:MAG: hypothetical protein A2Z98_11790 [Spirochaetes bacterium GWB1_27_13]OHD27895.1 MAG: hypothetical protein A2Y34_14630 [Spirochaetes bacterium GWC1_27_15]
MIKPNKYLDLDYSVINICSLILEDFINQNIISYDELIISIIYKIGEKGKEIVPYSLNFLFLLGKLKYYPEIDSFEILK